MHAHTPAYSRTAHGPSSSSDRSRQAWLLVPVALAVFLCSALLYYHIRFGGVGAASNPAQQVVVGLYRLLGFVPSLLVGVLLLVWSTIWFLGGRVERPMVRVSRLLAVGALFAILLSLQPAGVAASPAGGMLGGWFAVRLTSALGYAGAALLVTAAALASVCLATDFFFSRWVDRRGASSRTAVEDEVGVEDQAVAELAAAVAAVDDPVVDPVGGAAGVAASGVAVAERDGEDADLARSDDAEPVAVAVDDEADAEAVLDEGVEGAEHAEPSGWRSRRYARRYRQRYEHDGDSSESVPDEVSGAAAAADEFDGLAGDSGVRAESSPQDDDEAAAEERENLRHGVRVLTPNARAVVRADLQPTDRSTPGVLDVNTAARKVLAGDAEGVEDHGAGAAASIEEPTAHSIAKELAEGLADSDLDEPDPLEADAAGLEIDDQPIEPEPAAQDAAQSPGPSIAFVDLTEPVRDQSNVDVESVEAAEPEAVADEVEDRPTPWQPRRRWTRDELQAELHEQPEEAIEDHRAVGDAVEQAAEAGMDDASVALTTAEEEAAEHEEGAEDDAAYAEEADEEVEDDDEAEYEEESEADDAEYEEEVEDDEEAEYEEESEDDAEYEDGVEDDDEADEEVEDDDEAEYEEESEADDAEYEEESEDDAEYEEEVEDDDDTEYEEESEDDAEYEEESEEEEADEEVDEDEAEYEEESEDDTEYEEAADDTDGSSDSAELSAAGEPSPLPPGAEPIGDHLPPRLFELPQDLVDDAVALVQNERRASVTLLQRRLRIDHDEARHVLEVLRQRRVVGGSLGDTHGPLL